jgi:hypothetical protein
MRHPGGAKFLLHSGVHPAHIAHREAREQSTLLVGQWLCGLLQSFTQDSGCALRPWWFAVRSWCRGSQDHRRPQVTAPRRGKPSGQ